MIYTSYFAKMKYLPEDVTTISICGKAPEFYTGLQYKKLAPKYDFFMQWKQTHDDDYYIKNYCAQVLSGLKAEDVVQELYHKAKSEDICLLCYEKPSDFCHRHLVAKWLVHNGYSCEEYRF